MVDAMTGQDAANTARAFNEALPLTGVILTKTDGDARGGRHCQSARSPGGRSSSSASAKTTALEPFHPDRVASRILGMGDVLSLVEEVTSKVDQEKAARLATKIHKGETFDLGTSRSRWSRWPTWAAWPVCSTSCQGWGRYRMPWKAQVGDKEVKRLIAIVNSMTPAGAPFPAWSSKQVAQEAHRRRLRTQVQDVNKLLKQFTQMQKK